MIPICLWAFDAAECFGLYCQPFLMTTNGTEQIIRVSKPLAQCGVCCFTREIVNQSKRKVLVDEQPTSSEQPEQVWD